MSTTQTAPPPIPASPAASTAPAGGDHDVKKVRRQLVEQVETKLQLKPGQSAPKDEVARQLDAVCASSGVTLAEGARAQLLAAVVNELCGYGPIQPLLDDPTVSEV